MPPNNVDLATRSDPSSRKNLSVQVVSITGYLVGVKEEIFTREFKTSIYQSLEAKTEAKILRSLCIIRTALIRNFGSINTRLRSDAFCNLNKMPDYIDPEVFTFLSSQGIEIIKPNPKPMQYLIAVNKLINDHTNQVKPLFPMWVEWRFIRSLFHMPKGGNEKEIRKVIEEYHESMNSYPYHCYINWPIHNPAAYSDNPEGNDNSTKGNVLQNDKRFLTLLYAINHSTFQDFRFITDISESTKSSIEQFLFDSGRIVIAVDCENSDPYKLCAVLGGLREAAFRSDVDFGKLQKIILIDDVHTVDAWDILKDYVSVPIEHIQTQRVNDHKSLVDIQLTAAVVREHYAGAVDSFLLASSDSDFWGLIKSLPSANFMMLLEKDKYGQSLIEALDLNGVNYCFMDHFAGYTDSIKTGALDRAVSNNLADSVGVDLHATLDSLYDELRVNFTEKQKANYYKDLIKRLDLEIVDGVLRVVVRKK